MRLLGPRDRAELLVHPGDRHTLQPPVSVDAGDRVREVERDVVVVQALQHVAGQAGGVRQHLVDRLHVRAFQRQPPGHDHADVAGTQDDDLPGRHPVVEVDVSLRHARRVHAGRPLARDGQRAARALPAAHRERDGAGMVHHKSFAGHDRDRTLRRDLRHRGVRQIRDAQLLHPLDEAARVLGPGEALPEAREAEAVVDALAQDAAQRLLPLHDEDVPDPGLVQPYGGREPRRAPADDQNVKLRHGAPPPSPARTASASLPGRR